MLQSRAPSFVVISLLLLALIPQISHAQTNTCDLLVQTQFVQTSNSCSDIENGAACHGSDANATFTDAITSDVFDEPGDTVGVTSLEDLLTMPLNIADQTFGVAVMDIKADLPVAFPESVTMLLIGDTQIEGGVEPEEALVLPDEALGVAVLTDSELREEPSATANSVAVLPGGTALQADGMSADSQWLRVYYRHGEKVSAWVNVSTIATSADITTLPVITPESRTSMQEMYLLNGQQNPCPTAPPPMLLIQGPRETEVNLTVNDADIRLHSTIILQSIGASMRLYVLDGSATVFPDTPFEILLPEGTFIDLCQLSNLDLGIDDLADDPQVFTEQCLTLQTRSCTEGRVAGFAALRQISPNLLNYPLVIPAVCVPAAGGGGGGGRPPVVPPGLPPAPPNTRPEFVQICVRASGNGGTRCFFLLARFRPDLVDPVTGRQIIFPIETE